MNPPAVRYLARRCDCSRSFEERIRRGKKMPPEKYRITVLLLLLLWSLRLQAHLNHNSIYPLTPNISKEIRVWQFLEKKLIPAVVFILSSISILWLIRIAITTHLLPLHCLLCLILYNSCVLLLWPATRLHLTHLAVKQ